MMSLFWNSHIRKGLGARNGSIWATIGVVGTIASVVGALKSFGVGALGISIGAGVTIIIGLLVLLWLQNLGVRLERESTPEWDRPSVHTALVQHYGIVCETHRVVLELGQDGSGSEKVHLSISAVSQQIGAIAEKRGMTGTFKSTEFAITVSKKFDKWQNEFADVSIAPGIQKEKPISFDLENQLKLGTFPSCIVPKPSPGEIADEYAIKVLRPTSRLLVTLLFPKDVQPRTPHLDAWQDDARQSNINESVRLLSEKCLREDRSAGGQAVLEVTINYALVGHVYVLKWTVS